jgi:hypothetical protein
MAILRKFYVLIGYLWYGVINYLSYQRVEFEAPLGLKILYSLVSFILLTYISLSIVFTKRIYKKSFKDLSLSLKLMFILGIVIVPLISLYY